MSTLLLKYFQQVVNTPKPDSSVRFGHWLYLALFVVTYFGFLWYLHITAPAATRTVIMNIADQAATRLHERNSGGSINSARVKVVVPPSASISGFDKSVETTRDESSKVAENIAHATPAQTNEWISQASGAQDAAERTAAIVNLTKYASDRDVLQAMAVVLDTEVSSRNRALAVGAVASLAGKQKDNSLALSLLQRSITDADPRVSMRARAAYNRIVGMFDESEQNVTE